MPADRRRQRPAHAGRIVRRVLACRSENAAPRRRDDGRLRRLWHGLHRHGYRLLPGRLLDWSSVACRSRGGRGADEGNARLAEIGVRMRAMCPVLITMFVGPGFLAWPVVDATCGESARLESLAPRM